MAAIDEAIDDAMTLARAMARDGKMPEAGLNEVDAIPWFVKRVVEREISFTPEVSREEILEGTQTRARAAFAQSTGIQSVF